METAFLVTNSFSIADWAPVAIFSTEEQADEYVEANQEAAREAGLVLESEEIPFDEMDADFDL